MLIYCSKTTLLALPHLLEGLRVESLLSPVVLWLLLLLDWRDLSQRSLNWKDLRLNRVIFSLPQESHSLSQLLPNSSRYYQINGSDWRRMAYGDWWGSQYLRGEEKNRVRFGWLNGCLKALNLKILLLDDLGKSINLDHPLLLLHLFRPRELLLGCFQLLLQL